MSLIEVKELTKKFGDQTVLNKLSVKIEAGNIYTLIGKNGAGKTTFIKSLLGMYKNTSGKILTNLDTKRDLGVMLQENIFPTNIKVGELIKLHLSFYKKKADVTALLEKVQLQNQKNKLVDDLSGGQKRRLSFLLAVAHDPKFIILDEPTTGMDFDSVRNFIINIKALKANGKTILMITHDFFQIEEFSDHLLILNAGEIEENILMNEMKNKKVLEVSLSKKVNQYEMQNILYQLDDHIVIVTDINEEKFRERNSSYEPMNIKVRNLEVSDIFKKLIYIGGNSDVYNHSAD
ncbi:ABC transporter ATP-binding protein [Carnobacterium divergens]|uniref:ABC transporter ATP-binding protein n=1 Tax=Carnobacterium divergens TaxID=2748 RepID=A0AAW8RG27_CARDV|nr:ABC transporter ATP-binding protein [Carnobacterium divergens]MDT1959059.1 ABC transporter ATP-binding protein [Carnobacterium divergens]MDT1975168.1 ABC transporter ATP-binding protein [Carnobacterium divergens]